LLVKQSGRRRRPESLSCSNADAASLLNLLNLLDLLDLLDLLNGGRVMNNASSTAALGL
jgi:hypothetical protein